MKIENKHSKMFYVNSGEERRGNAETTLRYKVIQEERGHGLSSYPPFLRHLCWSQRVENFIIIY